MKYFSLREAIEANPTNWENCSMYVQDIKSPGVNVTAEIPEAEAHGFKKFCQIMTTFLHKNIIEEYISKLLPLQAAIKDDYSILNVNSSTEAIFSKPNNTPITSLENLKFPTQNAEKVARIISPKPSTSNGVNAEISPFGHSLQDSNKINGSSHSLNNAASGSASANKANSSVFSLQSMRAAIENIPQNGNPPLSTPKKSENVTRTEYISKLAKTGMMDLLSRSEDRIRSEKEIIDDLSHYFYTIDSTAVIFPFGSSTYGFGGLKTNFNILALSGVKKSNFIGILDRFEVQRFGLNESRKLTPETVLQKFENLFETSAKLRSDYGILGKEKASRVHGNQLKIVHKKSHIQCVLHFEESIAIRRSSQIIQDYMTFSPICKFCFEFVFQIND